jgi:acylphosphatase
VNKRIHARVIGKVQGVFFRYHAKKQAKLLKLTGWVKNLSDGSVEIVAEGKEEDLDKLMEWCRRGPPFAKVNNLTFHKAVYLGEFEEFKILYS